LIDLIRWLGKKCSGPCGFWTWLSVIYLLKTRTPQSLGQKNRRNDRCCFCCFDPVDDPLFVCSWWKNILKYILRMTYSEKIICRNFSPCSKNATWRITDEFPWWFFFHRGTFQNPQVSAFMVL
jgi:hypothetical protein